MSEHDAGAEPAGQELPPIVVEAYAELHAFILKHWLRPPDEAPEQAQQPPE